MKIIWNENPLATVVLLDEGGGGMVRADSPLARECP
jgi:hypothetical protein